MTKIHLLLPVLFLFFLSGCTSSKKQQPDLSEILVPEKFIPELSNKLHEISGLIVYDDLFWGFNDSGGKNKIYGFSQKGNIKKEVELKDAKNHDWEAITQDDNNIYVGDFGNNHGNRKNLCIYKFKKKDLKKKKEQKVGTKKISFSYSAQNSFKKTTLSTRFDCEAMFAYDNYLYIFSKNWNNFTTQVYKVPTQKGDYKLQMLDSFKVDMLVTGADISPDKQQIALLGYKDYQSYIQLFTNFKNDNFFKGERQFFKIEVGKNLQSEGICYYNKDTLLVSCEKTNKFKQQVFLFDISSINNGTH